jgi:S1-C subfamily serine protease
METDVNTMESSTPPSSGREGNEPSEPDRTQPVFLEPPASGPPVPPEPPRWAPLPPPADPGTTQAYSAAAPPAAAAPARPPRAGFRTALMVAAALIAGAISGGVVASNQTPDTVESGRSATSAVNGGNNSSSIAHPQDIQGILAKVEPGVVSIRTQAARQGRFFPSSGAGTGVVLTPDGEVLTNAHVVAGATTIEVRIAGEENFRQADLVGAIASEDVALLKIRNASGLKTVELGKSSELKVGDDVIAIGNALDLDGGLTVTEGIVSALNRSISDVNESLDGLIQTDAAINPGNSGGPLVNADGEVVGINTAVAGDAQNIGFAIAIDTAKPLIDSIRSGRPVAGPSAPNQAYLGVSSQTVDAATAAGLGIGQVSGALITSVETGSAAEKAGLRPGDVVVSVGGTPVTTSEGLGDVVRSHKPGDAVDISWLRGRQRLSAQTTLGSR